VRRDDKHARITWEQFVQEVTPEATELARDSTPEGVDAYLGVLAASAWRLDPASLPRPSFSAYPGYPDDVGFALTHRGAPFIGVEFWIEPGASLPFHPHPGGSVCTVFLEGSARVRNFEFHGTPDWEKKGEVLVRETRSDLLTPGRISLVGNPRDNIHGFVAGPEGARGIDITTGNRPEQKRPDTILEIGEEPTDPELGIYTALWRAK